MATPEVMNRLKPLELKKLHQEEIRIKEVNRLERLPQTAIEEVTSHQEIMLREKCQIKEAIQADKEKYLVKKVILKEVTVALKAIEEVN